MSALSIRCPWCPWFGMTRNGGDGKFLKQDFLEHVRSEHPEYIEVAERIEPDYIEPKKID